MPASAARPSAPSHRRASSPGERSPTARFGVGLARAAAGAVLFSLPLYMTQEMWELGASMSRARLALLVAVAAPFLVGLSHVAGFEPTFELREDAVDAAVAWAVGVVIGTAGLVLLGVLGPAHGAREWLGSVTLQAIPGSIGALLAQSQLQGGGSGDGGARDGDGGAGEAGGAREAQAGGRPSGYGSQLLVMAAGALFLAFNVAPTEEVSRVARLASAWHLLALVGVTLVGMHAFVYALEFRGQESLRPGAPGWSAFLRFTLVGWGIAVAISAWMLWTFGRLDGLALAAALRTVLVLAIPASIGAAAARVIL